MLKKICNLLSTVLIIFLAAMAAVLIIPSLFGAKNLVVLSGSMEPGIPVGSVVIIRQAEPSELEKGDVVTYSLSEDTMVTHRVVKNDSATQTLIMKGDANDVEDPNPIPYENVVGKMLLSIPALGYVTIYAKTPLGIAAVCGIVIILLVTIFLPDMLKKEGEDEQEDEKKPAKKRKKKKYRI